MVHARALAWAASWIGMPVGPMNSQWSQGVRSMADWSSSQFMLPAGLPMMPATGLGR